MFKFPKIIAEIGCNHQGSMDLAIAMIDSFAQVRGVHAIKLQKRNPKELLTQDEFNAPHPNPINSFGSTYGEHREFLEFSLDEHKILKQHIEKRGLIYSSSIWDLTSLEDIISLNPQMIKIPSALNYNKNLLEEVAKDFKGEIHISLGMTAKSDVENIFELLSSKDALSRTVFYACTSKYPAELNELYLGEISYLKNRYGKELLGVGFSGHHRTVVEDSLTLALGATYLERHVTLNKGAKGTDHLQSLEVSDLKSLVSNLESTLSLLSVKPEQIPECEMGQFNKLKKSQVKWN